MSENTSMTCENTDLYVKGQLNENESSWRNWEGFDKNPFIKLETCVNEESIQVAKFTYQGPAQDKFDDIYCTNFSAVEFSRDIFGMYNYHYILIKGCNDSESLCLSKWGKFASMGSCQESFIMDSIDSSWILAPLLALSAITLYNSLAFHHPSTFAYED